MKFRSSVGLRDLQERMWGGVQRSSDISVLSHPGVAPPPSFSPPLGWKGVVWTGARATSKHCCQDTKGWMAFVAVNNGLTSLLGRSTQEPKGRHAEPEAGGCPALHPPGDPRSGLPGISLQVSAYPSPRPCLSGSWV